MPKKVFVAGGAAVDAVRLSAWHAKDSERYPELVIAPPGTVPELTVQFMSNAEIVATYGKKFDGLSVTDRRQRGHTTISMNRRNWDAPPRTYGADLPPEQRREHYRFYVMNHEIGHFYGYDHAERPRDPSDPCPTMLQQTKFSGPGICATPASIIVGGGDPPPRAESGGDGAPLRLPRDTLMAEAQASLAFDVLRRRYNEMFSMRPNRKR